MNMTGYTKLFGSIVHSTIWREPNHVRLVWITMLALADQHGEVSASVPGLADAARVSVTECEASLAKFMSPDPYSRTKANDGRRIEPCEGGWLLLNHALYREKMSRDEVRAKNRKRQRRKRERDKANVTDDVTEGHGSSRDVTESNAGNDKQKKKQRAEEVDQSGAVAPSSEVAPPTAAELAKAIRAADIATVWASYIAAWTNHHPGKGPKPRLTTTRRSAISARLTDGHSVEALCSIPAKLFASAHHLGQNDRETAYLGSEYAFGKAERVERWLTKAAPRIGRGYVQHGGQEGIAMLPELNRRTAELKRSLAKETGT